MPGERPGTTPEDTPPDAAPGTPRPSLADWLPLLQFGRRHPPQPVHRLDTDTAGCLVLGRTRPSLGTLGTLFADRRAEKTYWAVVTGTPRDPAGILDAPLRKTSTREAGWRIEAHPDGLPASTAWRLLGTDGILSWLELRPSTGRTHQLRVHCALLGCPILGDPLYGPLATSSQRASATASTPSGNAATPTPGGNAGETTNFGNAAKTVNAGRAARRHPASQRGPGQPPTPQGPTGPSPASPRAGANMHLLARSIGLPLDPYLAATAPIPSQMAAAFAGCGAPTEP